MRDPARALEEQVREELKIGEATSTPMREALDHRVGHRARRVHPGGAAPVRAPGPWRSGPRSRWRCCPTSRVGAARSFFTGRGVFRSGMDMFLVGLGVAGIGYFVGDWIVKLL